ncbi:putative transcription factor C2H2 family [Helianthus annuus]|nr:putative transcription factor C2H2 family [Helianthus annuus]
MTNPANAPAAATAAGGDIHDEAEEYSEDFVCCVCLDLIYKPVVLACGHISCFWCVFEAMDVWQESRCPVCRHAYYHFPSICWLLHSVLLKLYPKAYQIRESQVTETEKTNGTSSPQFENYLAVSHGSEQMASQCRTTVQGKDCSGRESSEPVRFENNSTTATTGIHTNSSDQVDRCNKQISMNDLLCAVCKELLCRPVVLNCGHVFCEACIVTSNKEPCRCPVCRSMHPNGFPKVCLVLEAFLKQHVSEEYSARIAKRRTCEIGNSSTGDSTSVPEGSKGSSVPMDEHLCSSGHKVHFGVGCDCCGIYPLIGNRYKCKDCHEEIGFDLCEDCYKSSSNLPGRFNQQHKPDHEFEVVEPKPIMILPSDFPEGYAPDHLANQTDGSTDQDSEGDVPEGDVVGLVNDNDASGGNEGFGPTL